MNRKRACQSVFYLLGRDQPVGKPVFLFDAVREYEKLK